MCFLVVLFWSHRVQLLHFPNRPLKTTCLFLYGPPWCSSLAAGHNRQDPPTSILGATEDGNTTNLGELNMGSHRVIPMEQKIYNYNYRWESLDGGFPYYTTLYAELFPFWICLEVVMMDCTSSVQLSTRHLPHLPSGIRMVFLGLTKQGLDRGKWWKQLIEMANFVQPTMKMGNLRSA